MLRGERVDTGFREGAVPAGFAAGERLDARVAVDGEAGGGQLASQLSGRDAPGNVRGDDDGVQGIFEREVLRC